MPGMFAQWEEYGHSYAMCGYGKFGSLVVVVRLTENFSDSNCSYIDRNPWDDQYRRFGSSSISRFCLEFLGYEHILTQYKHHDNYLYLNFLYSLYLCPCGLSCCSLQYALPNWDETIPLSHVVESMRFDGMILVRIVFFVFLINVVSGLSCVKFATASNNSKKYISLFLVRVTFITVS